MYTNRANTHTSQGLIRAALFEYKLRTTKKRTDKKTRKQSEKILGHMFVCWRLIKASRDWNSSCAKLEVRLSKDCRPAESIWISKQNVWRLPNVIDWNWNLNKKNINTVQVSNFKPPARFRYGESNFFMLIKFINTITADLLSVNINFKLPWDSQEISYASDAVRWINKRSSSLNAIKCMPWNIYFYEFSKRLLKLISDCFAFRFDLNSNNLT